MARQSTQHKLDRVRAPRVQITYDVEMGGAIEMKELPFVMGVMGDFTGMPEEPLAKLKDRKFVEVNPDNFDHRAGKHEASSGVLGGEQTERRPRSGQAKVDLNFKSMDDFAPENGGPPGRPAARTCWNCATVFPICAAPCRATTSWKNCCANAVSDKDKLAKLQRRDGQEGGIQ